MKNKNILTFLNLSGEIEPLLSQIDLTIAGVRNKFIEKRPNSPKALDEKLSAEFWDGHKNTIREKFYETVTEFFNDEQLKDIEAFFNTESGKQYLKWKAHIFSKDSKAYLANVEMHRQANNIYNEVLKKTEV